MTLDEKWLIKQCLQKNPKAQKILYDTFSSKLYSICLRYSKDDEVAQDLLQDSFIKIYSKLHTYNHSGSFEGWLKRIVTNTSIEYYRKHKNISIVDSDELDNLHSVIDSESLETKDILKVIQSLPDGYRVIFNMYAIEGYSHKEIAEKLNISEGTSKSQLSRARQVIQNMLKKNDDVDTTD